MTHNSATADTQIERSSSIPIDMITGRPRTPNTQYTCLTDEQLMNIEKSAKSSTLFAPPVHKDFKDGPFVKDRFVNSYSQHLTRTGSGFHNQRFCYVDEQWNRFPKQKYDTCKPLASVKWGSYKCGLNTAGYFYGEPVHKLTMIDTYRRNPTNLPGKVNMSYGRSIEGYYTQKSPAQTTWNESSVPLNRTRVIESVPQKTTQEYDDIEQYRQNQLSDIKEKWPHYSEYTDRFAMKTRIMPVQDHDINVTMERRKKYLNATINEVAQ